MKRYPNEKEEKRYIYIYIHVSTLDKINTRSPLRAAKVNSIVSLLSEIKRVPRIRDPYPVTNVSIVEIVLHGDRIFPRSGSAGIAVYVPGIHPANVIPSKLSVIADFGDARQRARREKGGRERKKRIEEDGTSTGGREGRRRRGWRALSAGNRTRVATTDSCRKGREESWLS